MKKIVAILLATVLLCSLVGCGQTFEWPNSDIAMLLPVPPTNKGEVTSDYEDSLDIELHEQSVSDYRSYKQACIEKGFSVDAKDGSSSYEAHNKDGYKLRLSYYESLKELSISVDAPIEMKEGQWPTGDVAKGIPVPSSKIGKLSYEYSTSFFYYAGDTSHADYVKYVTAVSESGFNIDYSKGENYYRADNANGDYISVCYEGFNIMTISLSLSSEDTESTTQATTAATTVKPTTTKSTTAATTKAPASGISADFKKAMDDYEAFFDSYVDFMKRYNASGGSDLSLLMEYTDYLSRYSDAMASLEAIEDDDLNDAELAYYLEVMNRINKKLLEIYE